jgi:hypothetical protein
MAHTFSSSVDNLSLLLILYAILLTSVMKPSTSTYFNEGHSLLVPRRMKRLPMLPTQRQYTQPSLLANRVSNAPFRLVQDLLQVEARSQWIKWMLLGRDSCGGPKAWLARIKTIWLDSVQCSDQSVALHVRT